MHFFISNSCSIKIKSYPFHEIKFQNSGYVSFGIPKQFFASGVPSTDENVRKCRLKFKIINADGTEDFRNYGEYFGTIERSGALSSKIDPTPNPLPDKFFVKVATDNNVIISTLNLGSGVSISSSVTVVAGKFYAFKKNLVVMRGNLLQIYFFQIYLNVVTIDNNN